MKTIAALALLASATASLASAADVAVVGAQREPMMTGTDVRIASKDILNHATALLNKNTVATDNNVMVARSNIVMAQNDRLALARNVEEALTTAAASDPMATAVLTKNVLRAVSAPDDDAALMTKATAVVATKNDPDLLARTIARFVDAAMDTKKQKEQSLQANAPRSIMVGVGTTDLLRQPTAAINKNVGLTSNQVSVTRSDIMPTQNDQVVLRGAKIADVVAPASAITVDKLQADTSKRDDQEELEKKKKKKKKSGKKEAAEDEDVESDDEK